MKKTNTALLIGGGVALFLAYSVATGGFMRFLDMLNVVKPWPSELPPRDRPEGWEGTWPPKMYWV
jgi:hypothetical protein